MSYELVKVEKKDHLTVITINRPEVRNAISPPTSAEMSRALNEFDEDPDQWVCILTGTGDRAFSAGNDLKYQAEHGIAQVGRELADIKGGQGGICDRHDLFKPVIAAVNGMALGGGFEVVLACDIIIAADHALFGFPEPRVGQIAIGGGVYRLPRHIPYHLAMGVLLSSKRITAKEALAFGIVNEVVPGEDLMAAAASWADEIMKGAPLAIQATKEAAIKGMAKPLDEIEGFYPLTLKSFVSQDCIEGPIAFAQKRPPKWKGR